MSQDLTIDQLKSSLRYDPETGIFTRIKPREERLIGKPSGCIAKNGHRYIYVRGKPRLASRLAWFYIYGKWPIEVDHKNLDPSDDRLDNLREATRNQNNHNTRRRKNNTSGYKGVTWDKRRQKWMAQIMINRTHRHLGYFDEPFAGHQAYCAAANLYHGAFARTS